MINVPLCNPVRFRPLIGQTDANFDNTFAEDWNGQKRPFSQIVAPDDWLIQVVSDVDYYDDEGQSSDLVIRLEYADGEPEYLPDVPVVTELQGLYYYNYNIRPSFTGCFQMIVEVFSTETDYFRSEWCEVQTGYVDQLREDNPDVRKIEWFNQENAFAANFVESGFVGLAYVEAKMYLQSPAGDVLVFDNQGDEVKLKEVFQRVFQFSAELPDYLCETLALAMAHDRFFINDVEFISNKKPAFTQLSGRSNMYRIDAELKQVTAIGLNTHDAGFDCDALTTEKIMNITETGSTTDFTVEAPAGYLLHVITVTWISGTGSDVYCGTTEGGTDIMTSQTMNSGNPLYTEVTHLDIASATTLFFSVDGTATVDVNFQFIKSAED